MNDDSKRGVRQAVALNYDGGTKPPTVVAKGEYEIAERIVAIAREAGVPLYQSPELAALLARLELDQEIPLELYQAVAEVLAFVYRLRAGADRPTGLPPSDPADGQPSR